MKRTLIVTEGFHTGGVERSLIDFVNNSCTNNMYITILCLSNSTANIILNKKVNIIYINQEVTMFFEKILISLKYFFKIKNFDLFSKRILLSMLAKLRYSNVTTFSWNCIKKYALNIEDNYDVVIAFKDGISWYYSIDKVISKKKYAWNHIPYKYVNSNKTIDIEYLKKFDAIFCVSNSIKKEMELNFVNIYQFKLLYNYINVDNIKKLANEKVNLNKKVINIVTVGRLVPQKGIDLIIEVADKLEKSNKKINWYIIGNGKYEKKYIKSIRKRGLTNSVFFLGAKKNPYCFMQNCDIYVQPSRYEGYGLTLAEAKIVAPRILASNIPEFIEQDDNFIKFCNFNVNEFFKILMNYEENIPYRNNIKIVDYKKSLDEFYMVMNGKI